MTRHTHNDNWEPCAACAEEQARWTEATYPPNGYQATAYVTLHLVKSLFGAPTRVEARLSHVRPAMPGLSLVFDHQNFQGAPDNLAGFVAMADQWLRVRRIKPEIDMTIRPDGPVTARLA